MTATTNHKVRAPIDMARRIDEIQQRLDAAAAVNSPEIKDHAESLMSKLGISYQDLDAVSWIVETRNDEGEWVTESQHDSRAEAEDQAALVRGQVSCTVN